VNRLIFVEYVPNQNKKWFELWKQSSIEKRSYLKVENGYIVAELIKENLSKGGKNMAQYKLVEVAETGDETIVVEGDLAAIEAKVAELKTPAA
jgi:hypothetical protein